jgi:hypothetical protein
MDKINSISVPYQVKDGKPVENQQLTVKLLTESDIPHDLVSRLTESGLPYSPADHARSINETVETAAKALEHVENAFVEVLGIPLVVDDYFELMDYLSTKPELAKQVGQKLSADRLKLSQKKLTLSIALDALRNKLNTAKIVNASIGDLDDRMEQRLDLLHTLLKATHPNPSSLHDRLTTALPKEYPQVILDAHRRGAHRVYAQAAFGNQSALSLGHVATFDLFSIYHALVGAGVNHRKAKSLAHEIHKKVEADPITARLGREFPTLLAKVDPNAAQTWQDQIGARVKSRRLTMVMQRELTLRCALEATKELKPDYLLSSQHYDAIAADYADLLGVSFSAVKAQVRKRIPVIQSKVANYIETHFGKAGADYYRQVLSKQKGDPAEIAQKYVEMLLGFKEHGREAKGAGEWVTPITALHHYKTTQYTKSQQIVVDAIFDDLFAKSLDAHYGPEVAEAYQYMSQSIDWDVATIAGAFLREFDNFSDQMKGQQRVEPLKSQLYSEDESMAFNKVYIRAKYPRNIEE